MSKIVATANLVDVNDDVTIDLSNKAFGAVGILFSGTFGATGRVEIRMAGSLAAINPPVRVINPIDGVSTPLNVEIPGLIFHHALFNTLRMKLVLGTVAVTDIDIVVFAPSRRYYSSGYTGSVA